MTFLDQAAEAYEKTDLIDPKTLNTLVLEYLVNGCFLETTTAFINDTPTSPHLIQQIDVSRYRKQIRTLLLEGKIDELLVACEQLFPGSLTSPHTKTTEIVFLLNLQKFIELVKLNATSQALKHAQQGIHFNIMLY